MSKLAKLGAALDEDSHNFLLREHPEIAKVVEDEVKEGATPDEIGNFVLAHIGPDRMPFVRRCVSAARHVQGSAN